MREFKIYYTYISRSYMCSKSKKRTKRGPAMSKHEPSSLVKKAFIHVSVTDKNKESKEGNEKKKREQAFLLLSLPIAPPHHHGRTWYQD